YCSFLCPATPVIAPLSLHDALPIWARKGLLIPFSQAAVPEIDVSAGFVRVDPIAAGLVGDADEDGEPDEPGSFNSSARQRGPKRSEEHTSELQSRENLVCRLLLEKK